MESVKAVMNSNIMICHDMKEEMKSHNMKSCHDITSTKEMISKNDYFYLVEVLTNWRVFYPKAQIKKYGAVNCWIAMQRVKASNPRVPGAYFTVTVRNMIKNDTPLEDNKTSECEITPLKRNECINKPEEPRKLNVAHRGLPNITNLREAYHFLSNLKDSDLEDEKVYDFVQKIKFKYNFA